MARLPAHSYEELRSVIVDVLLGREKTAHEPCQFVSLLVATAEVLARRSNAHGQVVRHREEYSLGEQDAELVRDVFWDLFRQGFITLGLNNSNPAWPWFRLSHRGQEALQTRSPFNFHDAAAFIGMIKREVADVSPEAVVYLGEAVSAFYSDCLLAACVMLGVAAEAEFLRLVDVACKNPTHGQRFAPVQRHTFIRSKITAFHKALGPLVATLPNAVTEDLDTNLSMIQSVLRVARNDAGHPSGTTPQREQVYVFLQMFVPFARQLMKLRTALT